MVSSRSVPFLCGFLALGCADWAAAETAAPADAQAVPLFVPAEELLEEAHRAQPVSPEGWIVRGHGGLDAATADRLFILREYHRKLRDYDARIWLLRAELASLHRRLENYHYFNKAGALYITVENTQLAILAAEEQLRSLRLDRMDFVRNRP